MRTVSSAAPHFRRTIFRPFSTGAARSKRAEAKIRAVRDENRACAEGKGAHVLKGNVQARRGKIWTIRDENRACAEGKGARKMRRVIDSPWIFLYDILILTKGFRIPS